MKKGDLLLVLESMKMETKIYAGKHFAQASRLPAQRPASARHAEADGVAALFVKAGQVVDAKTKLVALNATKPASA